MPRSLAGVFLAASVVAAACGRGPVAAEIDTRHDACRFCRMTVSDVRFAGQIVAPGDEPLVFDDLGCLGRYVSGGGPVRSDAVIFVADHRTKAWIAAPSAIFTRVAALETPMSSHLIAHADRASRDADGAAAGGTEVAWSEIVPATGGNTR